jgi:biotin transporter BioY
VDTFADRSRVVASSYDSGGFLVAFIVCGALAGYAAVRYVRAVRRRRGSPDAFRWRVALFGTFVIALITGLRRFVLHQ